MSNKPYSEPVRFAVSGFRLNEAGEVQGNFSMSVNVRSVNEAVEQVEYVFRDETIRVMTVERTNH